MEMVIIFASMGETITAGSPMLPQPGGSSAISLYNPHSDPTSWLYSSPGMELSVNPLANQLVNQLGVPRCNPPDNPSAFEIQPCTFNVSWARILKERGREALHKKVIRRESLHKKVFSRAWRTHNLMAQGVSMKYYTCIQGRNATIRLPNVMFANCMENQYL